MTLYVRRLKAGKENYKGYLGWIYDLSFCGGGIFFISFAIILIDKEICIIPLAMWLGKSYLV